MYSAPELMQMSSLSCMGEMLSALSRRLCVSTRERGECTSREELRTCLLLRYDNNVKSSVSTRSSFIQLWGPEPQECFCVFAVKLATHSDLFAAGRCGGCDWEDPYWSRQPWGQPRLAPGQSGNQTSAQEGKGTEAWNSGIESVTWISFGFWFLLNVLLTATALLTGRANTLMKRDQVKSSQFSSDMTRYRKDPPRV